MAYTKGSSYTQNDFLTIADDFGFTTANPANEDLLGLAQEGTVPYHFKTLNGDNYKGDVLTGYWTTATVRLPGTPAAALFGLDDLRISV